MDESNNLFIRVKENNDEIALKKLMKIVNKWLPNHIYNIIKDKDKTDDIIQEAWLTVWNKRSDFNPSFNFNGWIAVIARNIAFKWKTEKYVNIDEVDCEQKNEQERDISPEDIIIKNENQKILKKAFNLLSEKCKELIRMKYFESLKYKEIASILGLNFDDVRNHLHLCRMNLKENLKKLGY